MKRMMLGLRNHKYRCTVQEAAVALKRECQRRRGTCPAAKIRGLLAVAIGTIDTSHSETTTRIWYKSAEEVVV
jgi:hypothetical protein